MAIAPEYLVFNGGTNLDGSVSLPRRPSTDDLGGDKKLDEDDLPPDDETMPTAAGHNQQVRVVAALSGVAAACKIEVQFTGSTPSVVAAPALGSNISIDATFDVTDNGLGDTTIEWPQDTFPAETCSPSGLTLFSTSTQSVTGHVEKVTNGIRVRTFVNNAAADVPWTIHIN